VADAVIEAEGSERFSDYREQLVTWEEYAQHAPDQMTQDTCGKKFPPTSPYGLTGLYPQA
jgi:hypothetical protein